MRRRFAEPHGRTLDFSSPADASSLTPSRPDYDTVFSGGEEKGEGANVKGFIMFGLVRSVKKL
jgi:hypothetical protein